MSKNLLLALSGLVAGAILLVVVYLLLTPTTLNGTQIDPPKEVSDFTLTSDTGPVSLSDLRGKLVVMYFGYTFCPDVCPATLSKLNKALERLGKDADQVQVIMVTVDPERDTADKLGPYVRRFNPQFTGLSGTAEDIAKVAKEFGIFYEKKAVATAAKYLVDHTASVLVLDRDGRISLIWPFEIEAAAMASDLRVLLRKR
jgi:protein SCO1/2